MKRGRKVTASKKAGAKKAAAAEEVEETAEGMDVTEPVENEAAPASGVSESTASQSISDSTTLPVPTTIHVTGLQRPWNDEELKSRVIAVSGSDIVDYHVNDRRSEAFVTVRACLPQSDIFCDGIDMIAPLLARNFCNALFP